MGETQPHLAAERNRCSKPASLQQIGQSVRGIDIVVDDEHAKLIELIWNHAPNVRQMPDAGNPRARRT